MHRRGSNLHDNIPISCRWNTNLFSYHCLSLKHLKMPLMIYTRNNLQFIFNLSQQLVLAPFVKFLRLIIYQLGQLEPMDSKNNETKLRILKRICSQKYDLQSQTLVLNGLANAWMDILEIQCLPRITELGLGYCQINDAKLKFLQKLNLCELKSIQLYYNSITSSGIENLVQIHWPKLQSLGLTNNKINNEGLKMIIKKLGNQLKRLRLCACGITGNGLKEIHYLKQITVLSLRNNNIRSQGIKLLVKSDLVNLILLSVSECQIGDEGAQHLAKSHWPNIKQIWMRKNSQYEDQNGIKMSGYQALYRNSWKQIKRLQINESNIIFLLNSVITQAEMCAISRKITNKKFETLIDRIFQSRIAYPEDEF